MEHTPSMKPFMPPNTSTKKISVGGKPEEKRVQWEREKYKKSTPSLSFSCPA